MPPHPWDSPGKNTGVGCHFLLRCIKVKSESEVAQPCPTLHNPMDCSLLGSSVHGIFQARVLEWVGQGLFSTGDVPLPVTGCRGSLPPAVEREAGRSPCLPPFSAPAPSPPESQGDVSPTRAGFEGFPLFSSAALSPTDPQGNHSKDLVHFPGTLCSATW